MTGQLGFTRTRNPHVLDTTGREKLARSHSADGLVDGAPSSNDFRPVEFEWLGTRDPGLWNWLHVAAPVGATAAEIAFVLWKNPRLAFRLMVTGAYVGVPPAWACQLAGPSAHRPERFALPDSMAEQLVSSSLADEIALSQAAQANPSVAALFFGDTSQASPDRARVLELLASTAVTLDELYRQLAPWALHLTLVPAIMFVRHQALRLRYAPAHETARWAAVITGQHDLVREATSGAPGFITDDS